MWKELKLPENLKPKLLFQENAAFKNMWFSLKDYAIYVNTKKDFLLDLRIDNKTNKNKQNLRHEIEHVKQFWEIVRFGESNEIKKNPEAKNIEHIIEDYLENLLN